MWRYVKSGTMRETRELPLRIENRNDLELALRWAIDRATSGRRLQPATFVDGLSKIVGSDGYPELIADLEIMLSRQGFERLIPFIRPENQDSNRPHLDSDTSTQ